MASAPDRLAQWPKTHPALGAAARGSQVGVAGGAEDVSLPALVLLPVLHLQADGTLQGGAMGCHPMRVGGTW